MSENRECKFKVTEGEITLECCGNENRVGAGESFVIKEGGNYTITAEGAKFTLASDGECCCCEKEQEAPSEESAVPAEESAAAGTERAYVDQDACVGCGVCTGCAPDVFAMNADDKAEAIADTTADNRLAVQDAIDSCPVSAIRERE